MDLSKSARFVGTLLKNGVQKVARALGQEAVVVGKDWIQDRWNQLFGSKNILVLGPRESGKTSLIYYMLNGHPFQVENGEKRTPNPTATAAIVNEKFKLQHGNWQKIQKDVPGDEALRDTWADALEEINPRGIIYMLDGRLDEDELLEATEDIGPSVLAHYENSLRNLETLHVFLNFADQWADSPETIRNRTGLVRKVLEKHVLNDSFHQNLRTHVSHTQLSPEAHSWGETRRALYKFGADLVN
jgi:type IV secretory pathway ATPase VirB11/archaellum biosynthesis ATPase